MSYGTVGTLYDVIYRRSLPPVYDDRVIISIRRLVYYNNLGYPNWNESPDNGHSSAVPGLNFGAAKKLAASFCSFFNRR